jgi:hypothetical protein
MLQIATGKLFRRGTLHTNTLTGTLFSNALRLFDAVGTQAGTLTWTDALRERTPSLVFPDHEARLLTLRQEIKSGIRAPME